MTAGADASRIRELIPDGSTVAVGGAGLSRKPMALLSDLAASGAVDIRLVSFLGSVDVELLIAAGVVRSVHTSGVSLDGFGLAPAYRKARQGGSVSVVEWSEGSLSAALEAAARGLGSLPTTTSPQSDVVAENDWLTVAADVFTGVDTVFARAVRPDVALIHAAAADATGNIYIAGDTAIDGLLARASATTVASVERVEDGLDPASAAISRLWVDEVQVRPGGSWPTESHPAALVDLAAVGRWAGSDGTDPDLLRWSS